MDMLQALRHVMPIQYGHFSQSTSPSHLTKGAAAVRESRHPCRVDPPRSREIVLDPVDALSTRLAD